MLIWFDLNPTLLDFAGIFWKRFRSVVGVLSPRFVALDFCFQSILIVFIDILCLFTVLRH